MSISEQEWKKYRLKFGKKLKSIRLSKGLSQLDLANICDYEKTTISRIENGRTNVTLKTILKLSKSLDIPPNELFESF